MPTMKGRKTPVRKGRDLPFHRHNCDPSSSCKSWELGKTAPHKCLVLDSGCCCQLILEEKQGKKVLQLKQTVEVLGKDFKKAFGHEGLKLVTT